MPAVASDKAQDPNDSLTQAEIAYIFAQFDGNSDGQLQGSELDRFLTEVRSRSNTALLLQDFDTDRDNQLSLNEFNAMYQRSKDRRDDVEASRWQQVPYSILPCTRAVHVNYKTGCCGAVWDNGRNTRRRG